MSSCRPLLCPVDGAEQSVEQRGRRSATWHAGAVRISVRVHPGARQTTVGGSYDGMLVVRVTERAVDGKATIAVLGALADAFNVSKRDVTLVSGATSRTKIVDIAGAVDGIVLGEILARLLRSP